MSSSTWAYGLPKLLFAKAAGLSAILCLTVLPFCTIAQCSDVPKLPYERRLQSPEDFRKTDAAAAKAIDWALQNTDPECDEVKEHVNAYLLVWLSGHPDVIVRLEPSVFPFFKEEPELLYTALFAMARYELTTTTGKRSRVEAHVAALEAIGDVVKAQKTLRKKPAFKAFRKAWRRNQLEEWTTNHLQ